MPTIAVDFDATLHPYTAGWQGMEIVADEPPSPDCRYVLDELIGAGCNLVVHSARAGHPDGEAAIRAWLKTHDLARRFDHVTNRKIAAVVYLDDRAVHFDGNWWTARDAILGRL